MLGEMVVDEFVGAGEVPALGFGGVSLSRPTPAAVGDVGRASGRRASTSGTMAALDTTVDATSGKLWSSRATPPAESGRPDEDGESGPAELGRLQQLGRYIILGKLGAGGMSVVHEAYDPELDRKVALKILRGGPGGLTKQGRLLREGQALARINHINVVRVYDVGVDQGQLFIAMERIDGVTLRAWLAAAPRSLADILRVFIAAGRGLAEAHAAGIIHRDFKPENALIDATGTLRIVDFGLARASADELARDDEVLATAPSLGLPLTQVGAIVGTVSYMAPEQLAGAAVDARVDVFAFCVALFEALHGERPFAGETVAELAAGIRRGPATPATRRGPPELHALIVRGLAADPAARWPTIAALTDRLQALARPSRRRAAVAALLIAGVGAGVLAALPAAAKPCSAVAREVAETWSPDVAANLAANLASADDGFVGATWRRVVPQLDGYAARWSDTRVAVCEAREHGALSDRLHDLEVACLDSRRQALAASVAVIRRRRAAGVDEFEALVEALPDLASCREPARVQLRWAPPDDPAVAARVTELEGRLVDAEASVVGGDVVRAESLLAGVADDLAGLATPALTAELARVEGLLASRLGRSEALAQAQQRRFAAAVSIGDHEAAGLAAAELMLVAPDGPQRPGASETWQTVAETLLAGPATRESARATLLARVGQTAFNRDDFEAALRAAEEGLAIARQGPAIPWTLHFQLIKSVLAYGTMIGRYDGHEALYAEVLALVADNRADGHPEQIKARTVVAQGMIMRGELEPAAAMLDEARALLMRSGLDNRDLAFDIEDKHIRLASTRLDVAGVESAAPRALALARTPQQRMLIHSYVGNTLDNAGQSERAIAAYMLALAALDEGPSIATKLHRIELQGVLAGAYINAGRLDDAEASYAAMLAALSALPDPPVFFTIEARSGLGSVHLARDEFAAARRELEQVVPMLAGRELPRGFVGSIHAALSRAYWGPEDRTPSPADAARSREHIDLALRDFAGAPDARLVVDEIAAWWAKHPPLPSELRRE